MLTQCMSVFVPKHALQTSRGHFLTRTTQHLSYKDCLHGWTIWVQEGELLPNGVVTQQSVCHLMSCCVGAVGHILCIQIPLQTCLFN